MNHSEARLLIGAEPHATPSPELAEHLANCPDCAAFQREMVALDENIRRALEQAPPAALNTPASSTPTPVPRASASVTSIAPPTKPVSVWSGWALAASVAIASVLVILALRPSNSLAQDIVTHIEYESNSWSSENPAPAGTTKDVLARAGVALDMSSNKVMYARSCLLRGHLVPHLVVSTPTGPITVLVLPNETVKERTRFHEHGMTGIITPAPHGSIAVLSLGDRDVDAAAAQMQQSVRWLSNP